ncbi:MAG: hypothetical protein JRN20_03905 [Nitrososphaerota archaeon]|nr:hypothetical protein [Nitrososphaerota archaeon]MDG6923673.1 hypothetical protein [Nitrososphaerota archaeon]
MTVDKVVVVSVRVVKEVTVVVDDMPDRATITCSTGVNTKVFPLLLRSEFEAKSPVLAFSLNEP